LTCIYLIINDKEYKSDIDLVQIEKRFNIQIGFITTKQLKEYFRFYSCGCGYCTLILDKDNRILFSQPKQITTDFISEIIERGK